MPLPQPYKQPLAVPPPWLLWSGRRWKAAGGGRRCCLGAQTDECLAAPATCLHMPRGAGWGPGGRQGAAGGGRRYCLGAWIDGHMYASGSVCHLFQCAGGRGWRCKWWGQWGLSSRYSEENCSVVRRPLKRVSPDLKRSSLCCAASTTGYPRRGCPSP